MIPYRSDLKAKARALRRDMTDAERRLWRELRGKRLQGVPFYRQKPLGEYIVDFYAPAAALVIEVDGGQHNEVSGRRRDRERDRWLRRQGLVVLRFDNRQVLLETEAVVAEIVRVLGERLRNPPRSPFGKVGRDK